MLCVYLLYSRSFSLTQLVWWVAALTLALALAGSRACISLSLLLSDCREKGWNSGHRAPEAE
jgi:hypothetical protein